MSKTKNEGEGEDVSEGEGGSEDGGKGEGAGEGDSYFHSDIVDIRNLMVIQFLFL